MFGPSEFPGSRFEPESHSGIHMLNQLSVAETELSEFTSLVLTLMTLDQAFNVVFSFLDPWPRSIGELTVSKLL